MVSNIKIFEGGGGGGRVKGSKDSEEKKLGTVCFYIHVPP